MAVPPRGAKIIFEAILKTFAEIDYKHTEPNIKPIVYESSQRTLPDIQQVSL
jgi:DNA (cytosine-5)-methyltransferase 1